MAVDNSVAADATLRSVRSKLADAAKFIPAAFAVIDRYAQEHGPVVLRLGVSRFSRGKRPNYRIDDAQTGAVVAVIDGNNHQPWTGQGFKLSGVAWSTAAMTRDEVSALMNEVLGQPAPA